MQDSLASHIKVSQEMNWHGLHPDLMSRLSCVPYRDVDSFPKKHENLIKTYDAKRDENRAKRMLKARSFIDLLLMANKELCWESMTQMQGIILGESECHFRTGSAYAKNGNEKYGYHADLKNYFINKIKRNISEDIHPILKALRLYLDICFFHPFENGNARLARLCFDYFFTKYEFSALALEPIFLMNRFAGHKEGYLNFIKIVSLLCVRPTALTKTTA